MEALQEIEAQDAGPTAARAKTGKAKDARQSQDAAAAELNGRPPRRQRAACLAGRRRCSWLGRAGLLCSSCFAAWHRRAGSVSDRRTSQATETLPPTFTNSLGMEFVLVPKGKSWLGGGGGKPGDKEVEITHDFYLGKYEVTQEEWEKVMGSNPSHFSRTGGGKDAVKDIADAELKRFPVENVSWDDAQLFLERLNKREKEAGWVYRLPKEAEWEYACRGGPMCRQVR